MKAISRVIAFVLATMLVVTMFLGLGGKAYAADATVVAGMKSVDVTPIGNSSLPVRSGGKYSINFFIEFPDNTGLTIDTAKTYTCDSFNLHYAWNAAGASLTMKVHDAVDGKRTAEITVYGAQYKRSDRIYDFSITKDTTGLVFTTTSGNTLTLSGISGTIPASFLTVSTDSSGNDDDYDDLPTPDILIESVRAFDKNGKELDKVTEDTDPFTLEVYYSDYGLIGYGEDVDVDYLEVYATNTGGFKLGSTRGRLYKLGSNSKSDAARFAARFQEVTYDGGGNSFAFRVHYDIWGDLVVGTTTATVSQAEGKEEEEDDNIPPATPHIIISQYSYGEQQIIAGDEYTLGITYQNTSKELALENIVMTITPRSEHTIIASASNTVFVEHLPENGALNHPIALRTLPTATGSQNIDVSFDYEYIVTVNSKNKERRTGKDTVSISIPVTQIDRFNVDPITEVSEYAQTGQAFNVTVSFVNEGKTPIYNISARARGLNMELISSVSRVEGALQASANNSLDIDILCNTPGELMGEVVVTYEDENTNQKEIVMPFSAYLQEPYAPEKPWDPGMMDPNLMQPEQSVGRLNLILSIVGGLLVAAPIALYVSKRVKAKGSEEFDEDF